MTMQSITNGFNNIIRQHSTTISNNSQFIKIGTVTSYNPNDYTAKVTFEPYDPQQIPETGEVPIATVSAGNGRGMFFPPKIGDQVIIGFSYGQSQNGVILGYIFSEKDRPVLVPSGNFLIKIGDSGESSSIEITEAGTLTITTSQSVTVNSPHVNIGNSGSSYNFLAEFQKLKDWADAHTHLASGTETAPPTQSLPADVATSALKAN
jgi:phage baseplate assembly protein gpV